MKTRRQIIKNSLSSLAGIGLVSSTSTTLSTPALGKNKIEVKMAMSWSKQSPGLGTVSEYFTSEIYRLSQGQIKITSYGAGDLVPALEVFDAVQNGIVDIAHSASFYWQGKMPAAVFFTTVPFGLNPIHHQAWLYQGGGMALWEQLYAHFGVIPLAIGNSGQHMAGWFKNPVQSLTDLRGQKLRVAGIGSEIYRSLGAQTVLIPPPEITTSLSSGMIDGVEFLGPWMDSSFGFHKFAPFYYGPGFNKPNGTSELIMRKSWWDALDQDQQSLFSMVAKACHEQSLSIAAWQNAQQLYHLKESVQLGRFPKDIYEAAQKIAPDIIHAAMKKDSLSLKIYEKYQQAARYLNSWQEISTSWLT